MTDGTDGIKLVAAEVDVIGDLMTTHFGCTVTITITNVLGRRVVVVGFEEDDDPRDPTTHAYLVTYRYNADSQVYEGKATPL